MQINQYATVIEAVQGLRTRGFEDEFKFENGKMKNLQNGKLYRPDDLQIVEYHRYEGTSNPSDMSIIFAVEGVDGCKGMVISSYGTYADLSLVEFMDKVKIKERTTSG